MDRKMLTIILGVLLIAGFFLPYFSFMGINVSGFDSVKAPGDGWEKYIMLLIPLSGVLLLIGALNNENYILGRGILCILPLLTVLFMVLINPMLKGADFGDIIKTLGKGYGIGLWITIATSLVLAFYQPRARS
jgi:hypothetical protein